MNYEDPSPPPPSPSRHPLSYAIPTHTHHHHHQTHMMESRLFVSVLNYIGHWPSRSEGQGGNEVMSLIPTIFGYLDNGAKRNESKDELKSGSKLKRFTLLLLWKGIRRVQIISLRKGRRETGWKWHSWSRAHEKNIRGGPDSLNYYWEGSWRIRVNFEYWPRDRVCKG